jgi:7-cyano-7-deazaguanine synthase
MTLVRILLSGGLDSTACLVWALERGWRVDAVGFDYGQPHSKELAAARAIASALGVSFITVPLSLSGGLLDGGDSGSASVVPGRNEAFLRAAADLAPRCSALVVGATAEDQAVYEDCRPLFFDQMRASLGVRIYTPLIDKTKGHVWSMVPDELRGQTWSCYRGGDAPCGACGACRVRSLAIACDFCGAEVGVRCYHPNHGFVSTHAARTRASCA